MGSLGVNGLKKSEAKLDSDFDRLRASRQIMATKANDVDRSNFGIIQISIKSLANGSIIIINIFVGYRF